MLKPGYNICVGADSTLIKEHIAMLLDKFPAENSQSREQYMFWGDEPLSSSFWEKLTLQGLFEKPRVIILRNAQDLPLDSLKKISTLLGSVSKQIWLFLCFEIVSEKGKFKIPAQFSKLQFFKFAQEKSWYIEFPNLNLQSVKAFVSKEAKRLELDFSFADVEKIALNVSPDAGAIKLEMEKIALACPLAKLNPEALALLNYSQDIDIFAFLQGLQNSANPSQVWEQYFKGADNSDAGLFSFLAMLLREARILWQLLAGEKVFLPSFAINNKTALAKKLGFGTLSKIWDLALFADKGVKSGEHSSQQAFEILIASLFRLFNRSR